MNNSIDEINQTEPVAMAWVYTQFDVEILAALHTISRATKMEDIKKGASMIHAPGLNIMYGDAKGNVAWWASGKLYKLKSNSNRNLILNGATGEDDPNEWQKTRSGIMFTQLITNQIPLQIFYILVIICLKIELKEL